MEFEDKERKRMEKEEIRREGKKEAKTKKED